LTPPFRIDPSFQGNFSFTPKLDDFQSAINFTIVRLEKRHKWGIVGGSASVKQTKFLYNREEDDSKGLVANFLPAAINRAITAVAIDN